MCGLLLNLGVGAMQGQKWGGPPITGTGGPPKLFRLIALLLEVEVLRRDGELKVLVDMGCEVP
jgi:hypothetical protein